MSKTLLRGSGALLVCGALGFGCAQPPPEAGSLTVAIVATGNSGTVYRLPDGTALLLEGGPYADLVSLDGPSQAITVDVPTGDYVGSLQHAAGYATDWPLTRSLPGGGSDVVEATLLPLDPVTVVADTTVELVIRFQVSSGEVIEFAHGTLQAVVVVDESGVASALRSASLALTCDQALATPQAPPQLAARLPAAGTPDLGGEYAVRITGPWRQVSPSGACADAAADVALGAFHAGLADVVQESAADGGAVVCIVDGGGTGASHVRVTIERSGAAVTPTFLDLGDRRYHFSTDFELTVPFRIFDGRTLDLRPLVGSHSGQFTLQAFVSGTPDGATAPLEMFHQTTSSGSGTLTFR